MKIKSTLIGLFTFLGISANAQMVGTNCYMKGNLLEIGIDGAGGFEGVDVGVSPPLPGMHHRAFGNPWFGFVANPQVNAWLTFDGDFFTPGSPENGWGIELHDGTFSGSAWDTELKLHNNRVGLYDIPGSLGGSWHTIGTCILSDWNGNYTGSGYDLDFHINYYLNIGDLYYTTTVTITNNGSTTIPELFYYRNFDPDNNVSISSDFTTTNTIVSQPGTGCNKAHVRATSVLPASQPMSYVGMAGVGNQFRVSKGGFSNRDASDIWNGTGGLIGTVGATSFSDEAISLAYQIQNMAPGASETFKFVIILDDAASNAAINNLFYMTYPGSGASATVCNPTIDTVETCPGVPVPIGVAGSALSDFTWSWSPTTGLSPTTGPSVNASPTTSTLYTVTGTPINPCFSPVTQQIFVRVTPGPTITVPGASKCGSAAVTLTASGASTYTWSPATGLSATTGTSVSANPTVTTTYTITGTNAAGCIGTTTSIVTVTPGPTVTVPNVSKCAGAPGVTMTASGATTYTWSPATGLSATTGSSVTANPAATTTYTITGTNAAGCTGTTTAICTVNPTPTVTCPGATICPTSSTTLTASGATTYSWSPATGLSATTGASVTASPASTTTYTITGTNASGCTATTTAIVTVGGSITVTVPGATICSGSSATLTASGGTSYTWSPATGLSSTTGASVTANPTATTTYTITGTSAAGCTGTTTAIVTVNPLPTVTVPSASICSGASTTLTASGASTYTWSPATGLSATTGATVTANPTATTTYTITGTSAAGCTNTTTTVVTVNPLPTVSVNSASICAGDPATLTATGASTYSWSPATGLSATTGASVTATPAVTTTYTVTGTSAAGCTSIATSIVTISTNFDATITPAGPFCQTDAAVNLTAASAGGTWSGTGITNASLGTFDPTVAGPGSFTIQYLIPGACGDTATTVINVVATDNPNFTFPATICAEAAAVTLVPTTAGGTWSSSCGTCVSATGVFNPALASIGANTVTYTTAGMCPSTQTNTITVDQVTITSIDTTGVSCNGLADGTITINATGATQFSIDGGATFQTTNVFNVAAGTYSIVVQNANGCTASGTAVVTQPTPLAISVGIITPETCAGMCDGQIAALPSGGTVPYTVTWSGASTITGLTVTSACSGTYTATVTDGNGCTATGTVTMTSPASVTIISVTSNDPTCNAGTNGDITVVGSATVSQYSIDGGATFQATGSFTGLPAGTYPITVTDPAGCAATSTVTITEPTPVAVVASTDVTICNGQSTTLTGTPSGGTPGYTIGWNDPTAATTASVVVTPTTTTTYTITVSDANGCGPVTDNVTVTVNPPLAVTASPDASICPGASTSISASASGGNGGPYTYTWSPSAGLSSSTGANVTASPSATTTYTVTVTDGCTTTSASDFVVVTVYTLPTVTYSVDNTQGCSPVVVNFTNTMAAGTVSSSVWDFGNGTTGSGTTATGIFTASGCSDITLTVTTTDGCVVSTTTPNQICVYPNPVAEFSFAPQPTTVLNPEISFTNLSINGDSYNWNFAGLDSSTLANPSYVFPSETEGVYNVCLTVTTLQGCFDSICHNVEIMEEFLVYVPNAFTPDGDGINDIFLPQVMGEKPDSYELMIFNRWGELIFQSNNLNIGWDGTHKNVKSKEDTYVWKLKVKKRINEDKKEYVGHVNLLR